MNNFADIEKIVKHDLHVAQDRAAGELKTLWDSLRAVAMPLLPSAVIKEGENGTGYFDGLVHVQVPAGVVYKGVDEFGRMVLLWSDGAKTQVVFDRYAERSGLLISQRGCVPSCYKAEQVLWLVRDALANAYNQDAAFGSDADPASRFHIPAPLSEAA